MRTLFYIASKTGLFGSLSSSTLKLSKDLDVSQQTVSRKLRDMENSGLIKRTVSPEGVVISLADKGRDILSENYSMLKQMFEKKQSLSGSVIQGLGEGAYYISLAGYKNQIKKKLGFNPFPGTLNLSVDKSTVNDFLVSLNPIVIDGFSTKERTYGSIKAYHVKVNDEKAAIVFPERSTHLDDVIEIIAPVKIKHSGKVKITL